AARAAGGDGRVRLVIHDRAGPTTKADCLNRLYRALAQDEARTRRPYRGVLLHDAEDMVHPLALAVIDQALETADFVQLPVRPEFPPGPRWVSGHYCDEFVESHAKAMVVRSALGAGLPAAGVGCAFSRVMLEKVAHERGAGGNPFAAECLTEDYELGLLIARLKGRSRFLRLRDGSGQLIGTRSYFPATLPAAVRQKTRWIHGISLQSWERLGWSRGLADIWMALRDRRGPLTALVLTCAYVLMLIEAGMLLASLFVPTPMLRYSPAVLGLMRLGLAGFFWRAAMRFAFSAREYGLVEGCFAVLRIPVANVITIMAGRRAFVAYCRSLRGMRVAWEKTVHINHPADHPVRLLRQMAPPAAGLGQAA
ncbi:MAG TPA: glycosyl transferase family protein, partial [Novosphingobium sp.]|nr:glycosyl transferase family protein [Novosphingobium sp.]